MREVLELANRSLMACSLLLWVNFAIKKALHMFQQNRYEMRRYYPWLMDNIKHPKAPFQWLAIFMVYLACSMIATQNIGLASAVCVIFTAFLALIFTQNERKHQYIKALNITARVKRQWIVMLALMVIVIVYLVRLDLKWIPALMPLVYLSVYAMIFVMAAITLPFENAIKAVYQTMAKRKLKQYRQLIKIGITGSYGKTSSKNILNEVLSEKYYVLSTPASFNTPMGLTITIREKLKAVHEVFIAEMGADKVGEINHLSKFIEPQYAIITSIGPQHLNTFNSLENIIKEKMRLVENLPVSGVAVLNKDNPYIRAYEVKNRCRILTYGIEEEADYQALDIQYSINGSSFNVKCDAGCYPFQTRLLGKHNIANILAAIAMGRELGLNFEQLQKAVKAVNYVEHRLQLKKINGFTYIDNAFNSNPEGAKMSLEVLKMMPHHRYIITPGMIDLGDKQYTYNKAFGEQMKGCADTVILVGKRQTQAIMDGLKESGFDMRQVLVVSSVKEAMMHIEREASSQDVILLENDLPDAFSH